MIHLILGRQGSGKTLLLVHKAIESRCNGKKIYSNFHLNFEYEPLDYEKIVECEYSNCYIFLDEIHLLLPARRSLRKINVKVCDGFLSMARKQNVQIFGTTQTARKVDVRFREEADYIYTCTKYALVNNSWEAVMHNQNLDPKTPILIYLDIIETYAFNNVKTGFFANSYFKLYDTNQVVKIKGLEKYEGGSKSGANKPKSKP